MILFDLGGVLVKNATFDELDKLLHDPMDRVALREKWLLSPAVRDFELGLIGPEQFGARFVREWDLSLSPVAFIDRFSEWPSGPYDGVEALVARLQQDHRVSCLSNCNEIHWARFAGFLRWFDSAHSSHIIGAAKPDHAAFAAAIGETPVQDALFLDDSETNVAAAADLGLQAYRVEGFAEVERVLVQEGLLGHWDSRPHRARGQRS